MTIQLFRKFTCDRCKDEQNVCADTAPDDWVSIIFTPRPEMDCTEGIRFHLCSNCCQQFDYFMENRDALQIKLNPEFIETGKDYV